MLNDCSFEGRLVVKPELKTTAGGVQFVKGRIAVQRDFPLNGGTLNSEGYKEYESDFIPFSIWNKTAPFAASLVPGQKVILTGRMQSSQYTTTDGQKQTGYELNVEHYYVLDKKNKETNNDGNAVSPQGQQQYVPQNNNFGQNNGGFNPMPQQPNGNGGFNSQPQYPNGNGGFNPPQANNFNQPTNFQ